MPLSPIGAKPFVAAGSIPDSLAPEMAAAVRQNLEGQGFALDAAGALLSGPGAASLHRLFAKRKTTEQMLDDLDAALAPPEEQILNRLDEALREAA